MTAAAILLTMLYVGVVIWKNRELPESISALVYELPRQWQWIWILWMWAVSFTACIPLIDALGEGLDVLGFVTLAFLAFCAAMPIKERERNLPHTLFGIGGCLGTQVCVLFVCPQWLTAWMAFIFLAMSVFIQPEGFGRYFKGKGVFLAEVTCAVSVYGAILTRLLN